MRLEVRNHLFKYDTIEMEHGTREVTMPGNLTFMSSSHQWPNHQHVYDKPWEKVLVFVRPQECHRCPK